MPSCSWFFPQPNNLLPQTLDQHTGQLAQVIALSLREVCAISVGEDREQENWHAMAAEIGDDPISSALALAAPGQTNLAATSGADDFVAGDRILRDQGDEGFPL